MDDHESSPTVGLWNERSATFCEKDRREAYNELIETQLPLLFPEFFRNLQAQTPFERERGRVAVLEYIDDEEPEPDILKSSQALQNHFEENIAPTTTTNEEGKIGPRKRLFILEDLGLNYLQILGSNLLIPPSFFAAHSADPATPEFNHRNPFRRFSEHTFVIRYASTQPVRIDADPAVHGTVFKCAFNVNRHVYCYDPKGPIFDQPKSYHALSFWTSGVRGDGSWDSVLLVDPPVGPYVTSLTTGLLLPIDHTSTEHAYTRMSSLDPDFSTDTILPADPSLWSSTWQRPAYISIFDDILTLSSSSSPPSHRNNIGPKTCTDIARKLVLCHFLAFLRRRILNMLRLQANPANAIPHVNRCDYLREFDSGVLSRWHHEVFGFVVNVKYNMGLVSCEAREHFEVLGLKNSTTATTTGDSDGVSSDWERDGWLAVQEHCSKIITMADAFLQSYLQFSSMQEAQAANRNALSLARITNLTMVFVPLGTIAAVFSMSEDFLPGKRMSWVFWVTAVPVLVVTFGVTMGVRGVLGGSWLKRRREVIAGWKGMV